MLTFDGEPAFPDGEPGVPSGSQEYPSTLEKRHLPPENRRVIDGRILVGRLKETLLADAGLLIGLSEGYKGSVILDDLDDDDLYWYTIL